MWSPGPYQQCAMEHLSHPQQQRVTAALVHHADPPVSRYSLGVDPRRHRHQAALYPYLQFPPPPGYPPPGTQDPLSLPSTSRGIAWDPLQGHAAASGPGWESQGHVAHKSQGAGWDPHVQDYSYAYYEPGPATRHANVPKKGSYRTRHTYLTRYGTEENIYEEITDLARSRLRSASSIMSLSQSLVEEEVRRVESGHRRVLGQLNLAVEAMLMPNDRDNEREPQLEDRLADLLTVGPTDDLLSPAAQVLDLDSGFSGSSSSASYRSVGGSLRRVREGTERPGSAGSVRSREKGFWGRKAWKKLTGFPSNVSLNKGKGESKDEPRIRSAGGWEDSPCEKEHHSRVVTLNHSTPRRHPHHSHHQGAAGGRTLQHTTSQRSSEDSWCSGSEPDISSDEESDRSGTSSTRGNSAQLRNTLHKARTLCDKWRGGGAASRLSLDSALPPGDVSPHVQAQQQGRLSRWFSIRRGSSHQYDIDGAATAAGTSHQEPSSPAGQKMCSSGGNKMPLLQEVEEETSFPNCTAQQRRTLPPNLSPPPLNLTPQQLKRRMIVAAIVHSENSYVATLQRLVNDYKKPLEESSPPILSGSKISMLFHRLPEILQCHTLFRIALAESIRNWDRDERIGDVFVASFSKAIVLDIYSGFINNFSAAMDLAKMEAKRKSALADFLKVKQISSHDRLSFFGLMVKPVQRFPQFILFLQDLLKHTPQGHHDRMSLQLALTQLESLAEMLNERKREAEQYQAFKEMLRHISSKFSVRPLSDANRYLLREDNVIQLEYNQSGMVTKAKSRRLLLLNDLVVCVSVAPKSSDDFGANERLSLKWTYPVSDVEIQETSLSPTLSRMLTAGINKNSSLKSNSSLESGSRHQPENVNNLCQEMAQLMHDYEVMSRVADLLGTLKSSYGGSAFTAENAKALVHQIQKLIQLKDEEIAWVDSCCLQLMVKSKGKEETFTFRTDNPAIKREWITELRLAQLALDPNNSPAWEVPEQEHRPSTKMPLFVKSQAIYKSQHQTEVRCGCYYSVTSPKNTTKRRNRVQSYLWVCTTDGASSHITILGQHYQHTGDLKSISSFSLVETQVTAMEFAKGVQPPCPSLASDTVWMGTDSRKILVYAADDPEKHELVDNTAIADTVIQIKYHCDSVFVALNNGTLLIYRRCSISGSWLLKNPQVIGLGDEPVSCILPINMCVYAACGKKVFVLNANTGEVQKSFSIHHEHLGNVNLMAHSGIGLWISLKHSSTICLYHTETFRHLQDINIASNVMRVTTPTNTSRECINNSRSQVNVTSLLACKGLLWVGTNVGIALTIPLPRLEGVPIISGRVNISYHAHFGPITFLLALQPKTYSSNVTARTLNREPSEVKTDNESTSIERPKIEKQLSDTSVVSVGSKLKYNLTSSPVVLRRRRSKDCDRARLSKTLPRGFGITGSIFSNSSTSSQSSGDTCDVYGLYGELMYVKDYEVDDNITENVYDMRRSDPELAAIPNKVSTLDRRLKMKVSRPRSLDLSNWSVDSKSSSVCTSSGSEESMALRHGGPGRSVSRNNSNASRQLNEVSEDSISVSDAVETPKQAAPVAGKTLNKGSQADNGRRTVITLMGGRGYVNWRQPCCSTDKTKNSFSMKEPNSNDAHIVIWELKL